MEIKVNSVTINILGQNKLKGTTFLVCCCCTERDVEKDNDLIKLQGGKECLVGAIMNIFVLAPKVVLFFQLLLLHINFIDC